MTMLLPSQPSIPVMLPESATALPAAALFQLGVFNACYQNRMWAREKVRILRHELTRSDLDEKNRAALLEQLKDREQVLISMERFYKKQRHVFADNFSSYLWALEQMVPGSSKGLVPHERSKP